MGGTTSTPDETSDVKSIVESHDIVVFSSPTCGFCSRAIAELRRCGYNPTVVAASPFLEELRLLTRSPTLPSIWVRGKYVGGCNDGPLPWHGVFPLLQSGRFAELLGAPRRT